jgi:hypothetical protein
MLCAPIPKDAPEFNAASGNVLRTGGGQLGRSEPAQRHARWVADRLVIGRGRNTMPAPIVQKRCMLQLGGYEPMRPDRYHRRFERELRRFERTWNVSASLSRPTLSDDGWVASWHITTRGPNWQVETQFRLLRWDDFVAADVARPGWKRVLRGLVALADFVGSGAALAYFRVNWRYGLFFAAPLVALASFAAIALALAARVARLEPILAPVAALAVFAGLFHWPGRWLHLGYLLDDWSFAADFVHRRRRDIEARLDRLAEQLLEDARSGQFDEIIVAGHSLGAAFLPTLVDRALYRDPMLGRASTPLNLMSTGSSLLKIGLHPAAAWLRSAVGRIVGAPAVYWVEYQALVDIINFYRTNPVQALKLPASDKPIVRVVHLRDMLDAATYRRLRGDFFRLHRQFMMGNDKRYFYDYYLTCCGPLAFAVAVAAQERLTMLFGPDGALDVDASTAVALSPGPPARERHA